MPESVRRPILAAWASYLVRQGAAPDVADALALGLEHIAAGYGVSIDRMRPAPDPAAAEEWRDVDGLARRRANPPDFAGLRQVVADAQATVRRREAERRTERNPLDTPGPEAEE